MRRLFLFGLLLMLGASVPANAQTNLGIVGGGIFPISEFSDAVDISPYIGARFEFQDVNALGNVAVLTYLIQAGFAPLLTKDIANPPDDAPSTDNGTYFDAGLGLRAYSSASPLFLSVGLSYVNLDLGGSTGNQHAGDLYIGLGLVADRETWKFDVEVRIDAALIEGGRDLQYFKVLASLGFPF